MAEYGLIGLFMDDDDLYDMFNDATILIEIQIDLTIKNKNEFSILFKKAVNDQYDRMTATYTAMDSSDAIKFEIGELIYDLERQRERITTYELNRRRKSQDYHAITDAYSDPEIAALVEYTKNGLKTRNKYYKR